MTDERRVSEEEAARLWRRAAELQAEAAHRLEARSRSLAGGEDEATDGYALEHVRAAAREAGIAPEFLDMALVELEAASAPGFREEDRVDRVSDRFLGRPPRHLIVSRVFDARPVAVYETLQRVLPAPPLSLLLVDTSGGHPLEGGVLVFDVPDFNWSATASTQSFAYDMTWCDVKQLRVRLAPLGSRTDACEVTIVAPLAYSRRLNFWVGGSLVALGGGVAGGFGVLAGVALATSLGAGPVAAAALVALGGLGGGGSVAGAGTAGWRAVYRYALRRGEKALNKLLQQVNVALQTGGAFAPPRPTFPPLPGAGGGGVTPPA